MYACCLLNPKYALAYFALWADENQRFCQVLRLR